jgi:hypothetical protein
MITEEQATAAEWETAYNRGLKAADNFFWCMGPRVTFAQINNEIARIDRFAGLPYHDGYRDGLEERLQKMI